MTDPQFPDRPDSDDFWLMAEVVQDLDAAADDGMSADRIVVDLDLNAVAYMAGQRALRAQNMLKGSARHQMAPLWFEAFVMGVMYQRRKGLPAELVTAIQSTSDLLDRENTSITAKFTKAEQSGDYSDADESAADSREEIHRAADSLMDAIRAAYPDLFA